MLSDVVRYLRCPVCAAALVEGDGVLRCESGHAFDVARQGYVNLLPTGGAPSRGDSSSMVAARERFLAAGHYGPLADALAAVTERDRGTEAGSASDLVVDLGAGTGYHLARAIGALPHAIGLALDSSKYALRRAARAHPRIGAVAVDAWRPLPVRDGVAALVLNVFAPRDPDEIARVLAPGGTLLVVTPTPTHLAELVAALDLLRVDADKLERLDERLAPALALCHREPLEWELQLNRQDAADAAAMGPSAWHADHTQPAARLPEPFTARASVTISVYARPAPVPRTGCKVPAG